MLLSLASTRIPMHVYSRKAISTVCNCDAGAFESMRRQQMLQRSELSLTCWVPSIAAIRGVGLDGPRIGNNLVAGPICMPDDLCSFRNLARVLHRRIGREYHSLSGIPLS